MPDTKDWGSAVLRDLGLTPTADHQPPPPGPPPAAAAEEARPPGTPPVPDPPPVAAKPPQGTEAPEPVPSPPAATPPMEAPEPVPSPPAATPPVDEAPSQPAPPADTAELPVVASGDPVAEPVAVPAEAGVDARRRSLADLDPERFTRSRHHREPVGRRAVHRAREVLGVSASKEVREATARAERLRQPVTTIRRLAVLSIRGGAGKTAVATLLATTLASSRHDRVLAVDAAPGLGSLALRAGASSPRPAAAFGRAAPPVRSFAEAEPHLGRGDSGLWLLTRSGDDSSDRLDLPAYQSAVATLSRFFAVLVTDCGPDAGSDLNLGILLDAHALALVTPATVDGVVSAHQALGWLRQTPAAALVPRTVVVLSTQTPHTEGVDLKRGTRTLASHGVRVARVPYDRHLAAGARIHPNLLGERTRTAAIGLAADLLSFAVSDRGGW